MLKKALAILFVVGFSGNASQAHITHTKATITIGIYHTLPLKKEALLFLKEAESKINGEIFVGRETIRFKVAFIKTLKLKKGGVDIDGLLPHLAKLHHDPPPDIYLILLPTKIGRRYSLPPHWDADSTVEFILGCDKEDIIMIEEISGTAFDDKIVLASILKPQDKIGLFLHELGHFFNLEHTNPMECENIAYIMCQNSDRRTVLDESYKKAVRDFYYQKTGQRFQPR